MSVTHRPLSPHLSIYKWKLTMALSILHRMTGVFLSIGAVLLVTMLVSVASGPDYFGFMMGLLSHPIGQLLLFLWSFSLFLHMANGVRHLFWDMGWGFSKSTSGKTGIWVVLFAIGATVLAWLPCLLG